MLIKLISLYLFTVCALATLPDFTKYRVHKYSPSEALIAAITLNGEMELWDSKKGEKLFNIESRDVKVSFIKFNQAEDTLAIGTKLGQAFLLDLKQNKLKELPYPTGASHSAIEFHPSKQIQLVYFGDEIGNVISYLYMVKQDTYLPMQLHQYNQFSNEQTKISKIIQVSDDMTRLALYFVNYPNPIGFKTSKYIPILPAEQYQGPLNPIKLRPGQTINNNQQDIRLGLQKLAILQLNDKGQYEMLLDSTQNYLLGQPIHHFSSYAYDDNLLHIAFGFKYENKIVVANLLTGKDKQLPGVFGHFLSISNDGKFLAVAKVNDSKLEEKGREVKIIDIETGNMKYNKRFDSPVRGVRLLNSNKMVVITEKGDFHLFDFHKEFKRIGKYSSGIKMARDIKPHFNQDKFLRVTGDDGNRHSIAWENILGCNKHFSSK